MSPIVIEETVRIPDRIVDLDSFRRWARSDEFPERGRFSFLDGELWIDMGAETLYTHMDMKPRPSGRVGSRPKFSAGRSS